MVKLTGPMMSIAASGKFADTMVFAKKGGTAYARQRVIPFNPRSGAQVGARALMKFISQSWAAIGTTQKATWTALAASLSGQNFNAYVHLNMLNWKQFLAPGTIYPILRTDTLGTGGAETATGQVGQTLLSGSIAVANANWGIMIFRSLTPGFTPSPNNAIAMAFLSGATVTWTYVDSGLAPGTYKYNYILFTLEGKIGTARGEDSAVVT